MDASTKIQIAKATMIRLADKIPAQTPVGLIAYGHTQAGDCNDIETLVPIGPMDKAGFEKQISALNPKGKTPIARSILQALALIRGMNGPVNIVLVSDGLETCDGDACEIVRNAKAQGVNITMHVVGFGITEQDLSSLECIAQAGGGQYLPASNAEGLDMALEKAVEMPPAGDAWLSVRTELQGKAKDAILDVHQQGEPRPIAEGRTYESPLTNPRVFQLPSGAYNLKVTPMNIEGFPEQNFPDLILTAGDTVHQLVSFDQSVLRVKITRNGELSDATIQLFPEAGKKATASTRSYNVASHNPAKLVVPPGRYEVVVSSVEISNRVEQSMGKVTLLPGDSMQIEHEFSSGDFWIGARKGADFVDATISVVSSTTGKSVAGGRTYMSANSNPKKIILAPGNYRVALSPVKPAGLSKKTIEITIQKGQKLEQTLQW